MLSFRSVLPTRSGEGANIVPTHDELVARVNLLAARADRQDREIANLKAVIVKLATGHLAAPAPARTLDQATTPRKVMAYIGAEVYGKTDDTAHLPVRNALLSHAAFRPIREKLAAEGKLITGELALLRALASRAPDGRLVFAVKVGV